MNVGDLAEVNHPRFVRSIKHSWKVHTRSRINIVTPRRMDAQILMQGFEVHFGFTISSQVHRKHATTCPATKGSVIEVVIKYHEVTGIRLQRDATREIGRWYTEKFLRPVELNLLRSYKVVWMLTAGDDPQTASISRQLI